MNHSGATLVKSTYEFKVLKAADNLLCECLGTLLKLLNLIRVVLLELGLDGLHVTLYDAHENLARKSSAWGAHLEVGQVGLLVEASRLETERVDDVVDSGGTFFDRLLGILRGRVSTY